MAQLGCSGNQRRGHRDGRVIVHGNRKAPVCLLRDKVLRFEGKLHLAQRMAQRRGQLLGPRRRHHALRGPDKELVLQHVAQPVERMTHRRLAEADFLPGPGDVTLLHHRIEDDQQVEIEGTPIHLSHVDVTRMHFQHASGHPMFAGEKSATENRCTLPVDVAVLEWDWADEIRSTNMIFAEASDG